MKSCRICENLFFQEPLIRYKNMPALAQNLPDSESLANDHGITIEVYQCSGCGLVQLSNEPVPYYREVIRAAAVSEKMKRFRDRQFRQFVERNILKGKKVIEIGCGSGEYLSIMQNAGAAAYGIEYGAKAVSTCLEKGLKVTRGFIEESSYKIADAPFDAFFILNFLEHLPFPNMILRGIYNNLRDGAVGLVEVPNFNMILNKGLFSEFTSDHLFYFTRDTLSILLAINGFEVIKLSEVWEEYIISAVVKKKGMISAGLFNDRCNKIKKDLNEYLARFCDKRVAVWGAGHQALAIIAITNIAERIKYVIDSAPFKQGRYTPATHIPIVAPSVLDSDPPDAIIVMGASYSDEIASRLTKSNINISILRDFGLEDYNGH